MNINTIMRSKTVSEQIESVLCERIRQGVYPQGQRMPAEDKLAQELGVSRASVRTAMASLVAEGYIYRRHGDGTYPSPRAFEIGFRIGKLWDIMRQIEESGRVPELKTLEQTVRPANEEETKLLEIPPSGSVMAMRRLFLADGKPIALISNIIRTNGKEDSLPPDAAELAPLDFLARFHDNKPSSGTIKFYAIAADAGLAQIFQIESGCPLLTMHCMLFDQNRVPVMAETEIYPGDEGFQMQAELIKYL
jgi:GntR family transcriptional regulator